MFGNDRQSFWDRVALHYSSLIDSIVILGGLAIGLSLMWVLPESIFHDRYTFSAVLWASATGMLAVIPAVVSITSVSADTRRISTVCLMAFTLAQLGYFFAFSKHLVFVAMGSWSLLTLAMFASESWIARKFHLPISEAIGTPVAGQKKRKWMWARLPAAFFPFALLVFGYAVVEYGGAFQEQARSQHWPSAQGHVLLCEKTNFNQMKLRYEFQVDGDTFAGTRESCLMFGSDVSYHPDAERRVKSLLASPHVTVFYNPENPNRSVLSRKQTWQPIVVIFTAFPYLILFFLGWNVLTISRLTVRDSVSTIRFASPLMVVMWIFGLITWVVARVFFVWPDALPYQSSLTLVLLVAIIYAIGKRVHQSAREDKAKQEMEGLTVVWGLSAH